VESIRIDDDKLVSRTRDGVDTFGAKGMAELQPKTKNLQ
jgi:hypothetical protein